MIVVKTPTYDRQISTRNILSKLSVITLLFKNENRDEMTLKSRQYLNKADNHSSQNKIIITQKQTKIDKSTHKLHSLHPFI